MKRLTFKDIVLDFPMYLGMILLLSLPAYLFYISTYNMVVEEAKKEARSVATTTAIFISNDPEPYKRLIQSESFEPGSYDEAYYQRMLAIFRQIREQSNADFVFTEMQVSDDHAVYILDGEPQDSPDFSPIGSEDQIQPEERQALESGKATVTDLVEDPAWGTYISAFAPIIDPATGESLGLVGVDLSAAYITEVLRRLVRMVILIQVIITLLSIATLGAYRDYRYRTLNSDFLTVLSSKRNFNGALNTVLRQAQVSGKPFSVMMMDIDHFKDVNDNYGHLVGDAALRRVADMIRTYTRAEDASFRFGGDEFALLLPNTTEAQAEAVAERILNGWKAMGVASSELPMDITVSIGIAQWRKDCSAKDIVAAADAALYESKNTGRNRATVYKKEIPVTTK